MPRQMSRYHLLYLVLLRAKLRERRPSGRPHPLPQPKKRPRHPSLAFLKNFARLRLRNLNLSQARREKDSSTLNRKDNN